MTPTKSTRAQHTTSTGPMLDGRRDDSMRRRQRVIAVLDKAAADGEPVSTSAIARAAGVDRTFLYRHRDLLEKIHALQADPVPERAHRPRGHPCLAAGRPARRPRTRRPAQRPHPANSRSGSPQALGEHTWRESGLGAPADIDALHQRITQLEQHNLDLQQQLDERDEDLAAARAANRELMARLNTPTRPR